MPTRGRRLPDGEYPRKPGDYSCVDGEWLAKQPNHPDSEFGGWGSLVNHEVTEHEDGTITVSPSILMYPGGDNPGWHGYLERGVWREV